MKPTRQTLTIPSDTLEPIREHAKDQETSMKDVIVKRLRMAQMLIDATEDGKKIMLVDGDKSTEVVFIG